MVRASLTIAMLNPIERGLRNVLGHRGTVARRAASSSVAWAASSMSTPLNRRSSNMPDPAPIHVVHTCG